MVLTVRTVKHNSLCTSFSVFFIDLNLIFCYQAIWWSGFKPRNCYWCGRCVWCRQVGYHGGRCREHIRIIFQYKVLVTYFSWAFYPISLAERTFRLCPDSSPICKDAIFTTKDNDFTFFHIIFTNFVGSDVKWCPVSSLRTPFTHKWSFPCSLKKSRLKRTTRGISKQTAFDS